MTKGRLIVASTRLPVTMSKRQGGWDVRTSTGGLVTALKSVADQRTFTWLGWPGTHVTESEQSAVTRRLKKEGCVPVFLTKSDIEGHYEGFSNRVLWPLFHGLPERAHFNMHAWNTYKRVNARFADAILEHAQPEDVVWVHDYQLALVPEMLRRRNVHSPVGFFLHIPFPSAENYRTLPARDEILRGLLGADLLGFHAYEYVSHFRRACLRILGVESEPDVIRLPARRVHLGVLPIGIDPEEIQKMTESPEALEQYRTVRETYRDKKIIVGVDRLDYTKGIEKKFLAFEELLRAHPKWRDSAVLIQVAAPSRESVDEYKQLKRDVDELVGRINGKYSTASNTPIVYINQSVPRIRLAGLYRAADVALITPVRDGMNLVALEYVAARGREAGTLILSEFAGAAHLLAGARLVSPYNINQVAETLFDALEQEPDPVGFEHMLEFVTENTSMIWAKRFLDRLDATMAERRSLAVRLRIERSPAVEKLKNKKKRLMLLDYDGTLRPHQMKPRAAIPDDRIRRVLGQLAQLATVYLVSGRSGDILDEWLGDLGLGMVCEHGFAVKHPNGEWHVRRNVSGPGLRRIEPLLQEFVKRTPGSSIERKRSSLAWHYRAADPEYGVFQANELFSLLEDALKRRPYSVLRGSRVIEVRHENATKGHATEEILKRHADAEVLFCAGDDRTDEEMMEAIPRAWRAKAVTCWVGQRNAVADFWVDNSDELLNELEALVRLWSDVPRKKKSPPKKRAKG